MESRLLLSDSSRNMPAMARDREKFNFQVHPSDTAYLEALVKLHPASNPSYVLRAAVRLGLQVLVADWGKVEAGDLAEGALDPATVPTRPSKKR